MPASQDDLFARLRELGIETTTQRHPPVFTVEDAKRLRGQLPGGHTKNLFLKDKKGVLWLVVTLEDRDIHTKDLRKRIGAASLSFGRPELMQEVLGVTPGSVTPFGLVNDTEGRVRVVLDAHMMELSPLNFHPLSNDATTAISPDDLLAFIRATGHEPAIVDLSDPGTNCPP